MRYRMAGGAKLLVLIAKLLPAVWASSPAQAQGLYLAPEQTEADRVRQLVSRPGSASLSLEFRGYVRGDNNVMAMGGSRSRGALPSHFGGNSAYFSTSKATSASISKGHWSLTVLHGTADLFRGNADAAQTYLDSLSNAWTPTPGSAPEAMMNKSGATRVTFGYAAPLAHGCRTWLTTSVSCIRVSRVQLGALRATTVGSELQGTLSLVTTRGVPRNEVGGLGLSTGCGLVHTMGPDTRIGLWVENLFGRAWIDAVQQVDADINANVVESDADGFLHGLPILSGQITRSALQASLRRNVSLAAARRVGFGDALLLLDNTPEWRASAGLVRRSRGKGFVWALITPAPFCWQLGLDAGGWRLQFGESGLTPSSAYRGVVSIAYRVQLE